MSRLITLIGLLCVPIVTVAEPPPPPNADDPVNYIQWMNDHYGEGITENAADVYLKAVAAFDEDKELLDLSFTPNPSEWSTEQRERLRGYVEQNAEALKLYAQAARIRRCYFAIEEGQSPAVLQGQWLHLQPMRSLAKLTAGRARLRLAHGNIDGAAQDAVTLLSVCRHLQTQPSVIAYLVGLACGGLAYDSVLFEIPRVTAKPVDYNAILRAIKPADGAPRRPTRQLEGELLMLWDCAQRFLRDADGDGRYESMSIEGLEEGPLEPQTLDEIVRESREHYASVKEAFVDDYQKSKTRLEAIDRKIAAQKHKTLLSITAPSFDKFALLQRKLATSRNACRVLFLLHAYKAEHGHWPKDLKEALPKGSAEKLDDPFANKPFGYRLKDGQPLLYSVGVNGVDDRGKPCDEKKWGDTGDVVFWPPQD